MKDFASSIRSFFTRLSSPPASSARLQRGIVIGLNIMLAGAALISIAIRAQLADQRGAGGEPGSEDFPAGPNPPIQWDPMLNPVEYDRAEAPFKTEAELRMEEFAAFTISDPKGFEEQMLKSKTKENIDREESAIFAIRNPEAHRKQVDAQKNKEQREADQDSALAIMQPDTYKKQRARNKDSEEQRLEALAVRDILDPGHDRPSEGVSEPKPRPLKN